MDIQNQEAFLARINDLWRGARCPICQQQQFQVDPHIYELREFNGGGLVVGGPNNNIVPLVPITCRHCGYTTLVNAVITNAISTQDNGRRD